MMMNQNAPDHKVSLTAQLESLRGLVESAVREGHAVDELERRLFRGVLSLGHQLLGEFFARVGDGDVGETLTVEPACALTRSPTRHRRRYVSVFGEYELERYVYWARPGQRIEAVPFDARLGLPAQAVSYVLQDWSQGLAVEVAYRPVRDTLERIFGVTLGVSLLERQNQTMSVSVEAFWQAHPPSPSAEGEFIVISADGKGVPLRRVGRRTPALALGKMGPKADKKRLAIVGAVYDATAYVRDVEQVVEALFSTLPVAANDETHAPPRDRPIAKAVRAALPPVDEDEATPVAREVIFKWLAEQVKARDPHGDKSVVVLIDGQHCLWDDAKAALGQRQRVEILDLLHATATLGEMVHVLYPPGHRLERAALRAFTEALLNGRVDVLIGLFRTLAQDTTLSAKARETLRKGSGYFANHRHRMQYDQYLAAGYPIASGVIEGACRHVVKDRLERSGMRWVIQGAQAMLDLRCVAINGQWAAFTDFRSAQENQRLYPYREQLDTVAWPKGMAA